MIASDRVSKILLSGSPSHASDFPVISTVRSFWDSSRSNCSCAYSARVAATSSASWLGTMRMEMLALAFREMVVVALLLFPGTSIECTVRDGSRQRCISELIRDSLSGISGWRGKRISAMASYRCRSAAVAERTGS